MLVAPEKHALFEFSQKHDSDATAKLLEGYKGYLVADAHVVYDHLYRGGETIEVGCWSEKDVSWNPRAGIVRVEA